MAITRSMSPRGPAKSRSGGAGQDRIAELDSLSRVELAAVCSTILERMSNGRLSKEIGGLHGGDRPAFERQISPTPPSSPPSSGLGSLSARELEVLTAAATGDDRRAVGRSLQISERTVANHLARVYAKLGVKNRMSAVALAMDSGALDMDRSASTHRPVPS